MKADTNKLKDILNSINDINSDTRSNCSIQSNSSSNTIKSMLNTINKKGKTSKDIVFW